MAISLERLTSALCGRYTLVREIGRGGMATVQLPALNTAAPRPFDRGAARFGA